MTTEQAQTLRELRETHNVVRTYESRLAPPRVFAYIDDGESTMPTEVHIHADGRALWGD